VSIDFMTQSVTEEVVLRLTRSIATEAGSGNLSLAGGVALNCVANGKVLRDGRFKRVWIQPAAGDAGGALGAALAAHPYTKPGHAETPRNENSTWKKPQITSGPLMSQV
jgi:carbamoyltransferase